jgi:hypothetical protein
VAPAGTTDTPTTKAIPATNPRPRETFMIVPRAGARLTC